MKINNLRVLAVGSHPDDIEISCAGLLLILKQKYNFHLYNLVCTGGGLKAGKNLRWDEQSKSEALMGVSQSFRLDFEDGNLTHNNLLISEIEKVIKAVNPDIILSPSKYDHHQDHIAVSLSVVSALRRSDITHLQYPSLSTRVLFPGNIYVDISSVFKQKLQILNQFESQRAAPYMNNDFINVKSTEIGSNIKVKHGENFLLNFLAI